MIQSLPKVHEKIKYISILPYNGENFRTITLNRYLFLDSMSFLQSSLSNLTETLHKSNHSYEILQQCSLIVEGNDVNQEKMEMLLEKGFFPYSYW